MTLPVPHISEHPLAATLLATASILYTDLDGTLLARGGSVLADGEGAPSTAVAESIVALARTGLTVVPVSGRGRVQLIEVSRLLGWTDFIAEAGAITVRCAGPQADTHYDHGEWPEAPLEQNLSPFEIIEQAGAYEALVTAFPGRVEYHAPWHTDREVTHLLRGCLDCEAAQAVLDSLEPPIDIVDNGIVRNPGALRCGDHVAPHAYHLVPKGVSKTRAIALDLGARGLAAADAIAVGDSATDIEMADSVGLMVLVGNAFESTGVLAALDACPRANVVRVDGVRTDGWSQLAHLWLDARG